MLVPTTKTGCKFQGQITRDFTEINGYSQVHALRNLTEQIPLSCSIQADNRAHCAKENKTAIYLSKRKNTIHPTKETIVCHNTLVLGHFVAKHNGIYAFKTHSQSHHESHNTSKQLHYGQIYTICLTNHKLLLAMSSNHYSTLLVCFIPQFEISANNIVFVFIWDWSGSRSVSWISLV